MLRKVSDLQGDYVTDVKGTNVYGLEDEKLGAVNDALVDDDTGELRYLLVDSGWLSGRRFLVPADQVYTRGDSDDLYVNLRKADVESLPEFRDDALLSDAAFSMYESNYRRNWRYDADPARVRASGRLERFRNRVYHVIATDQDHILWIQQMVPHQRPLERGPTDAGDEKTLDRPVTAAFACPAGQAPHGHASGHRQHRFGHSTRLA